MFKVGDRVEVTKAGASPFANVRAGDVGVIQKLGSQYDFLVTMDATGHSLWLSDKQVVRSGGPERQAEPDPGIDDLIKHFVASEDWSSVDSTSDTTNLGFHHGDILVDGKPVSDGLVSVCVYKLVSSHLVRV